MFNLTEKGLKEIFARAGLSNDGIEVCESTGGIINSVYKVKTGSGVYFIKQAHINPSFSEKLSISPERINTERRAIHEVSMLLGQEYVPRIISYDELNYYIIMESVSSESESLRDKLINGEVRTDLAKELGKFLGRLHRKTSYQKYWMNVFDDISIISNLKLPIFYYYLLECEDYTPVINDLIRDIKDKKLCFVHGDFNPKNILTHNKSFKVIDWEQCHFGSPNGELGGFLAHYIINGVYNRENVDFNLYLRCIDEIMKAYENERSYVFIDMDKVNKHIGVYLIGRVDSVAKANYLDEESKNIIRKLGDNLLMGKARYGKISTYLRGEKPF